MKNKRYENDIISMVRQLKGYSLREGNVNILGTEWTHSTCRVKQLFLLGVGVGVL